MGVVYYMVRGFLGVISSAAAWSWSFCFGSAVPQGYKPRPRKPGEGTGSDGGRWMAEEAKRFVSAGAKSHGDATITYMCSVPRCMA